MPPLVLTPFSSAIDLRVATVTDDFDFSEVDLTRAAKLSLLVALSQVCGFPGPNSLKHLEHMVKGVEGSLGGIVLVPQQDDYALS